MLYISKSLWIKASGKCINVSVKCKCVEYYGKMCYNFSACSVDLSKQEEWPICMSLHYQSILLSLQSNDKYSEIIIHLNAKTVTLHRLSGALLSICTLRSSWNVFFSHPALIASCPPDQDSAEVRERSSAYQWEEKLSTTFTLQRKNSDASISRQQLCNNHRTFSSDFICGSIAGCGKRTERLKTMELTVIYGCTSAG